MDAERLREGEHPAYGRVLERPGPDAPDLLFGEVPEAHANYFSGVGVGLARPLVLDGLEEVVQPVGDSLLSLAGCSTRVAFSIPSASSNHNPGGKFMAFAIALSLSKPGFEIFPLRIMLT
jgi:hypothetical protein